MAGLGDLVAGALEDQPHQVADVRFVIDDQNPRYCVVPLPVPFIHSESLTGSGWMSARSGPAQAQQLLQDRGLTGPSRNNCCGAGKVTLFPEQADEEWE